MKGVRCKVCGRGVRSRGIYLFETPKGPAYVCGKKCLAAYNGTDVPTPPCECAAHGGLRTVRA